jgi:hypothetical protein
MPDFIVNNCRTNNPDSITAADEAAAALQYANTYELPHKCDVEVSGNRYRVQFTGGTRSIILR